MIEIKNTYGHIEVLLNGKFLFSADTEQEADRELRSQMITV